MDQEMCLRNLCHLDRRFFFFGRVLAMCRTTHLALRSVNARHALPQYQMAPSVAYWLTDKVTVQERFV